MTLHTGSVHCVLLESRNFRKKGEMTSSGEACTVRRPTLALELEALSSTSHVMMSNDVHVNLIGENPFGTRET